MKLSTLFAKLTSGKAQVFGGLAVACATLALAAPTASAQHVFFGVQIGGPRYVAPAPVYVAPAPAYVEPGYAYGYVAPRYIDNRRAEDWRAREWREHHETYNARPMSNRRDWR